MASREFPATAEMRQLLEGLLGDVPSGSTRAAVAAGLALLEGRELVPRHLIPAPTPVPIRRDPKGAPS